MKYLAAVMCLLCFTVSAGAGMVIPNIEATVVYNAGNGDTCNAFTSKVMTYKDCDFRLGYTANNSWLVAVSYDLANIETVSNHVTYLWGSSHLSLGLWAGYNFEASNLTYGAMVQIIEVNF